MAIFRMGFQRIYIKERRSRHISLWTCDPFRHMVRQTPSRKQHWPGVKKFQVPAATRTVVPSVSVVDWPVSLS